MPESTSPGQRFVQLIQQLGLSKNAFAQSLGKTATVIQHLVDERNKPGFDLLSKVLEVYPNVSSDWLLLGQGPMLRPAAPAAEPAGPQAVAAPPAIDLETMSTPPRRRPAPHGTLLQPADIAATVALAAAHATPAAPRQPPLATTAPAPPSEPAATAPAPNAPVVPPSAPAAAPAAIMAPAPPLPPAAPLALAALPAPGATPDPAYLAALLQAQHLQHQLALAEQRNQHLLQQQALLQQMVQLLQRSARAAE